MVLVCLGEINYDPMDTNLAACYIPVSFGDVPSTCKLGTADCTVHLQKI